MKALSGTFHTTWKHSAELLKATDPFEALVKICGKVVIGRSLSKFSCSQIAGLMGLAVTTWTPQLTVPLLLKKISDDLESLKSSLHIVRFRHKLLYTLNHKVKLIYRNNPQYMATEYLRTALGKLEDELFSEVNLYMHFT